MQVDINYLKCYQKKKRKIVFAGAARSQVYLCVSLRDGIIIQMTKRGYVKRLDSIILYLRRTA